MQGILVLNASYEPLHITPVDKALRLLLSGKASSLEDSPVMYRSAKGEIPVPYVMLLTHFAKIPHNTRPAGYSKKGVLNRDGYLCVYCSKPAATIDHVIPRSQGGKSTFENCVAACLACNAKKGNRSLKDMGWSLAFAPTRPSRGMTPVSRKLRHPTAEQLKIWGPYIHAYDGQTLAV